MKDTRCKATGCGKAIPAGQLFCRRCLNVLSDVTRHRVLFADKGPAAVGAAIAELDQLRGHNAGRRASIIAPAQERFRAARKHAADALATLDARKRGS